MSGSGAPAPTPVEGSGLRAGLIAAAWHPPVMAGLVGGARRGLEACGVRDLVEIEVPGSFELPVAASRLAMAGVDAIVALGVVVRGGTPHFDYVCAGATTGLTEVSTRTGIPIGFGLLPCDTREQALARAGLPGSSEDKGFEAAVAAISTAVALSPFPSPITAHWT